MKQLSLLLTILFFTTAFALAQNMGSVKGTIVDTASKKQLPNATISVVDAKDTALISFARSSSEGGFSISKLAPGSYLLMVSYTGFGNQIKPFSITAENPAVEAGIIPMTSNASLGNVIVTAAPVSIKGDTVEYNAGSFKTKPNAVVEDLLKKLPGVTVDKDGTIKANGQEIKKILVDGKQFFANDPKLATKNLQADMVNKVQVFDKKSDKSEFTGFDDGNSEPTINLTLKADKRVGVFGKVSAGAGTEGRYEAGANLNSFKKGEQVSFIGQANNINKQGFGLLDFLNGGGAFGGASQGITTTNAAGINYNNFKNKNLELNSSYFFNGTKLKNDYNTFTQTSVADSTQFKTQPGTSTRQNNNHRINFALDWKVDSVNSIKITPAFTFQNTETNNHYDYSTLGPKGTLLSSGLNTTNNQSQGYNFSTTALLKHKFARKGRTISLELKYGNNQSNADGNQYAINNPLDFSGFRRDTINQINSNDANINNYSVNLSYTEPVSKRAIVEINAYHNRNNSTSNRQTFNFNKATGQYDIKNNTLSNIFDNHYAYTGAGINYRENRKTLNYAFGATLQRAQLQSLLQGKTDPITQTFFNILPNAQLQYKPNNYVNLRINYRGSNNQPSVQQLQPIIDSTDQLNVRVGNPNLKQEFTNNLRTTYNRFDPYTQKSFFATFNVSQTFNKIVNNDSIGRFGNRKTTYNNVQGVYNINANIANGFPIKIAGIKANLNLNTGAAYSHNVNIFNNQTNKINNLSLSEKLSLGYTYKELFDISLGGGLSWNNVKYSVQPTQNSNYFTQTYSIDNTWFIPGGYTLSNDVDYTVNTGRANGFNPQIALWNASLAKSFLKGNKGELKFSVFDLLNQNKGVTRSTTSNYIEDQTYTVLKRYFALTFTLNLSKFGATIPSGPGVKQIIRSFGGGRNGF